MILKPIQIALAHGPGLQGAAVAGNSAGKRGRSLAVLVKFRFGMKAPSTVGHGRDSVSVKAAR